MMIVDVALKQRAAEGNPIRVGVVGAGVMAKGITRQIARKVPGMKVVAVAARRPDQARTVFEEAGETNVTEAPDAAGVSRGLASGKVVVTADHRALGAAEGIDVVVEATGSFNFAAEATLAAIEGRKHVVLVNAELDGTVGPILKAKADEAGVCYSAAEGDQPAVTMNLARRVAFMGLKVVLAGNIKGLQDRYRTPDTQRAFAEKWGLKPYMVTSFADGTKISFEQAVTANGLGLGVAQRGMVGPDYTGGVIGATPKEIDHCTTDFAAYIDPDGPGIVDYVVGAKPGPGVFVLATCDDAATAKFLAYMKMGDGPLYCFYTPYHLCHLELPNTIARAALFKDAALAPVGAPTVGVIACAKKNLNQGETIDGAGGFMTYGQCENASVIVRQGLLPIGLAEGLRLKRDVAKDGFLTLSDVEADGSRLIDRLYAEQCARFL